MQKKREKENPSKGTRRALGKDKTGDGLPTIMWNQFISLLQDNHENGFEIHAVVDLGDDAPSAPSGSEDHPHALALSIAKAVWTATGFRFKYVLRCYFRIGQTVNEKQL